MIIDFLPCHKVLLRNSRATHVTYLPVAVIKTIAGAAFYQFMNHVALVLNTATPMMIGLVFHMDSTPFGTVDKTTSLVQHLLSKLSMITTRDIIMLDSLNHSSQECTKVVTSQVTIVVMIQPTFR
jgi:hypothetical protein